MLPYTQNQIPASGVNTTTSRLVPNVTRKSLPSDATSSQQSHTGKQEFGDWQVYDDDTASTIVFDNSNTGTYTDAARRDARKPAAKGEPARPGHPAVYATAVARRKLKIERKLKGCGQRLFLPTINTHTGAFVPQDPRALPKYTEQAKKVFGDALATRLGRVGSRPRSVEEGLIRRWSRKAADTDEGGKGVFDATLAVDRAAGLLTQHTYRAIAYAACRTSANAVLRAVRANAFQFRLTH